MIEAVERVDMGTFKVNHRGPGSAPYHPRAMLALLIYCYANGIFSSRRIERVTHRDIGVRLVAANSHPDHDTIAIFRRENFAAVTESFLRFLRPTWITGSSPRLSGLNLQHFHRHARAQVRFAPKAEHDEFGEMWECVPVMANDPKRPIQYGSRADQQIQPDTSGLDPAWEGRLAASIYARAGRRHCGFEEMGEPS